MDALSALLVTMSIIALALSWVLMIIVASSEDFAWGMFSVLFPPVAYLYGLVRWDIAKEPLLVAAAGIFLFWLQLAIE